MAIGNPHLTEGPMRAEAEVTADGMAYFANTGPFGKTCGDCHFLGYRINRQPKFDARIKDWVVKSVKHNGCAKFKELTGNSGPAIYSLLKACKYFKDKSSE
jgi:hypothetical protein